MTLLMSSIDKDRRTGELIDLLRTYTRLGYTRKEILMEQIEVCGRVVPQTEVQEILNQYNTMI